MEVVVAVGVVVVAKFVVAVVVEGIDLGTVVVVDLATDIAAVVVVEDTVVDFVVVDIASFVAFVVAGIDRAAVVVAAALALVPPGTFEVVVPFDGTFVPVVPSVVAFDLLGTFEEAFD